MFKEVTQYTELNHLLTLINDCFADDHFDNLLRLLVRFVFLMRWLFLR